jgi:hypothetical protein
MITFVAIRNTIVLGGLVYLAIYARILTYPRRQRRSEE